MITELIGNRIKKYREDFNLSQEQLAQMVNITRPSISNWENGKSEPSSSQLYKLSEIFKTSMDDILGKSANKKTVVVVDTSALIKRPLLIGELDNYFDEVIIPDIVISELNNIKDKKNSSAKQKAWLVMKSINDGKDKINVEKHTMKIGNNDEKIADIAVKRAKAKPFDDVYILSDDIYFSFLTQEQRNLTAITPNKYVEIFHTQIDNYDIVQSIEFLSLVKNKKLKEVRQFQLKNININMQDPSSGLTPLITAIRNRDFGMVTHLLSIKGINIDERDNHKYHFSAIHHATQLKNIKIIQLLAESGADIDFGGGGKNAGNTPLMIAAWSGFLEGVNYFIANQVCINQQDNNGYTALMKACIKHHVAVVEELIGKTDISIRSRENFTAIDYLKSNNKNSVVLINMFKEEQNDR
jgi:transcriptional regulator with XRE-family HTH domain